jgi:aminocarboxymuconate-semialdehyde decarboxylase
MRIALDCHAHLAPAEYTGLPGVEWFPDEPRIVLDGKATLASPSVFKPAALLGWMDAQGIGRAWVSVPPPLYRLGLDEAAARQWCGHVNAGLAAAVADHPRLSPSFLLPVRHPALAAEIVREWAPRGARFAMAAGHAASATMLSDPGHEVLWAALDEARAFLRLHPTAGNDPRLDRFFLHNLLGGPGETALAAAHLAMSGVLERFPHIRFILSHGGGSAALVAGRLTRGQAVRRPGADTGARPVIQGFRDFYADCITHSGAVLGLAASVIGPEKLLFGSDWPFSMGLTDPGAQLADADPALLATVFAADPEA